MSDVILDITELHLQRGARTILAGATLTVARGALVALMGPSGSGKTTILRAVAGLEPFQSGRITVDGVTLEGGAKVPAPTRRGVERTNSLRRSASNIGPMHCRESFRAAKPSASGSRARWRSIRRCS
jgi:ABC-type polar amino acid transport system ATPase subunit